MEPVLPPLPLPAGHLRRWAGIAGRRARPIPRRAQGHSPGWARVARRRPLLQPHRSRNSVRDARPGRPAGPHGLLLGHVGQRVHARRPSAVRGRPARHLPGILARGTCDLPHNSQRTIPHLRKGCIKLLVFQHHHMRAWMRCSTVQIHTRIFLAERICDAK